MYEAKNGSHSVGTKRTEYMYDTASRELSIARSVLEFRLLVDNMWASCVEMLDAVCHHTQSRLGVSRRI